MTGDALTRLLDFPGTGTTGAPSAGVARSAALAGDLRSVDEALTHQSQCAQAAQCLVAEAGKCHTNLTRNRTALRIRLQEAKAAENSFVNAAGRNDLAAIRLFLDGGGDINANGQHGLCAL